MNTRAIEEKNTRRELVLMYLKENDGKLLTATEIADGIGEDTGDGLQTLHPAHQGLSAGAGLRGSGADFPGRSL